MNLAAKLSSLEGARGRGDDHAVAEALLELAESVPLFADRLGSALEWIVESCDLGTRTVITPRQEVLQVLRLAEVFLASGSAREAFDVATEACRLAHTLGCVGLEDRSWMVQSRALVRLGRQDDAVALFEAIVAHDVPQDEEEAVVPGLAFLAVGEAHLFEGRYDGAYHPLERAVELLPPGHEADRLRYDALVGLGMLDHRAGELETAEIRTAAAMRLADAHASRTEQVESLLLLGTLMRGRGKARHARELLEKAIALSAKLDPPRHELGFPTERLRNLVGVPTAAEMVDAATELARDCGSQGDLMGYVQITAIVAALHDLQGRTDDGRGVLAVVSESLALSGHPEAEVLRKHLRGYEE